MITLQLHKLSNDQLHNAWYEYYQTNGHNLNGWYLLEIEKEFYVDTMHDACYTDKEIDDQLTDMGYYTKRGDAC